jgi:NAD(P)-dependent dehydrogenase (short-subunit alcohol dehydrogenase family)
MMPIAANVPAVLVTGASSGIGRATALLLDRSGYRVFAGVRKEADAQQLRSEASERLHPLLLDITNAAHIAAAVKDVQSVSGASELYGLVNNAGTVEAGPLECMAADRFRRQFEVNVFGTMAVTQAFLPLLRQSRGRIVTIASAIADSPIPFLGAYAGSKCAVRGMMISLRRELRWFGVKVSVVMPGFITGPIWDEAPRTLQKVAEEDATGHYRELLGDLMELVQPRMNRGAPPEAVARTVRRALRSRWPRMIYRCGPGSRLVQFVDWLPEGIVHWVQARYVHRKRAGRS